MSMSPFWPPQGKQADSPGKRYDASLPMLASPPADPPELALVVFARAPVPGQVKTRLFRGQGASSPSPAPPPPLPPISAEEAATLHKAFVADVLRCGAAAGLFARRRLYVAGDTGDSFLREAAAAGGFALRPQGEGDLGQRMHAALAAELAAGAAGAVLIATDSPTLPPDFLRRAGASLLAAAPGPAVVIGPAADGGYYLIGVTRPCPALFIEDPIAWGTNLVLPATLARLSRLRAEGAAVELLPFFYDVDTPADLLLLRRHLALLPEDTAPHTLRALRDLGLVPE